MIVVTARVVLNKTMAKSKFQIPNLIFFFLIGKENSLRAKRLEKGYTQSIPNTKKQKTNEQTSLTLTWWLASQRNLSKTKCVPLCIP